MGKALGRGLGSIKKKKAFKGLRALIRTSDEDEDTETPQESQYRDIKAEYNKKKRQLMDKRNLYYKLKQEVVLHQLQAGEDEEETANLQKLEEEIQVMEKEMDEILLKMSKMERELKTDDGQDLAIVREGYMKRHNDTPLEETGDTSAALEEAKEAIAKESSIPNNIDKDIKEDENLLLDILKESMTNDVPEGEEPVIDDHEIEQAYEQAENEEIYSDVHEEEVSDESDEVLGTSDGTEIEGEEPVQTLEEVEAPYIAEPEEEDLGDDEGGGDIEDIPDVDIGALEDMVQDTPQQEDEIPDVDLSELDDVPISDPKEEEEQEAEEEIKDSFKDVLFKKEDMADIDLSHLKHFKSLSKSMEDEEVDDKDVVEYDQDDIKAWKERERPHADETTEAYAYEPEEDSGIYERQVSHKRLYDDSKIKNKMKEIKGIEQGLSEVDNEISKLQEQIQDMDGEAEYWEILHEKGFALSRIGQYDEAIYYYDKALQLNEDNEEILSNKGVALFNLDRREEAKNCFAKALKMRPSYEKAWNNLGVVMRAEGKLPEALRCYNQAIKANPFYKNAWYNKGFILEDMGELEEALKYYNKAIEINPNYAEAIYYRDECLAKLASSRLKNKEQLEKAYEEEIAELDRQLQEELDTSPDEEDLEDEPSERPGIPIRRPKKKKAKKRKKKKKKRA
jgi:tetratricopeptide (TPR) repeat protein